MKIGITNDHRGLVLKQTLTNYLENKGYNIIDYGTDSDDSVDYPDYAFKLGKSLQTKDIDLGIAICGTGIGMDIALNKVRELNREELWLNSHAYADERKRCIERLEEVCPWDDLRDVF